MKYKNLIISIILTFFGLKVFTQPIPPSDTVKVTDYRNAVTDKTLRPIDYSQPVNYVTSKLNYIETLIFIDTLNKTVIKEFDVKENNPFYNMLNIDISKAKATGNNAYSIDNIPINELITSEQRSIYNRNIPDSITVEYAIVKENVNTFQKNFVIIGNTASLYHKDFLVGVKNHITIQDINGNIVHTYTEPNLNVNYTAVTDNYKYLCFTYGSGDEWGDIVSFRYRIIDLDTKQIIVDEPIELDISSVQLSSKYNIIHIGFPMESKRVFYDLDNKMKYIRQFTWEEGNRGMWIETNGIKIKNEQGEYEILLFDRDFKVEDINN
ncbi:MAG: hypothetical protein R6W78_07460 [Bacteroidales bacterium]